MLNIEKYKEDILKMLDKENSCGAMEMIYKFAEHKTSNPFKSYYDLFNWLCSEYEESLLTDDEKEFLKDMMKWYTFDEVYISLNLRLALINGDERSYICVPNGFFENFKECKSYTLEELGL